MQGVWMIKRCLLLLNLFFVITIAQADNLNSATIIKSTLKALPKCLHYHPPTHFCIWIDDWGEINTTPIVSHYLPDLVVSVFNKPQDNPWVEADKIIDTASEPIQQVIIHSMTGNDAGSGNHSAQDPHEQNVIFKEVDVIGNPALTLIPEHGLLPSTATPWLPYFQSMTDSLLWRGLPPAALPEEGMALGLNLAHHIGSGLTNWGGIYPHEGKVLSDNDVKASAVMAARAADLLTNEYSFGHVFKKLSTECGEHCHAAFIKENNSDTYFQMIYPIEQNDCYILGDDESYTADMFSKNGAYTWIVWRHYEGCSDGDGKYLGRT
jgi:integrating conjugative element protein (TIGR03756 family)